MAYDFAHGSGTKSDPYLIATEADFWGIFDYGTEEGDYNFIGKHYKQTADLTLTEYDAVVGMTFIKCFYDGNGKTISGLMSGFNSFASSKWENSTFINTDTNIIFDNMNAYMGGAIPEIRNIKLLDSPGTFVFVSYIGIIDNIEVKNSGGFSNTSISDSRISNCYGENLQSSGNGTYAGAFADCYRCTFENIIIKNITLIPTAGISGGFVATPYGCEFIDCIVLGASIKGKGTAGGFTGDVYGGSFLRCYTLGFSIEQEDNRRGGGFTSFASAYNAEPASFEKCIAHGEIIIESEYGYGKVGGFVGESYGAIYKECGADVSVENDGKFVAGFVGFVSSSEAIFQNCYALGDSVSKDDTAKSNGGFVGEAYDVLFENCFSKGLVSGGMNKGGFCGYEIGSNTFTNCYYDSETSAQSDSGSGEPKTTAEMKTQSTFSSWNFLSVWKLGAFAGGNRKSITGENGEYNLPVKDGSIDVFLELDPSGGYPFLQFETKKRITKSGRTKCDWYVRGRMPE